MMATQRELNVTNPREELMLELLDHMLRPSAVHGRRIPSILDLLLSEGRFWEAQARPKGMARGEPKMCYRNATRLFWSYPDELTYVEGYAFPEGMNIPIEHAWCVDEAGRVVDNTWRRPKDAVYFGLPLAPKYLSSVLATKGTFGVLFDPVSGRKLLSTPASLWRANAHPAGPLKLGAAHNGACNAAATP